MDTVTLAPESRRQGSMVELLPVVLMTTVMGSALVLSSERGAKWFLLTVAACLASFAGLFFRDHRLYAVWLVAACVPIAIQYPVFPGPNGTAGASIHGGGAAEVPMVNLVDFPIALLALVWLTDLGLGLKKLPRWTRMDSGAAVFFWLCLASMLNTTEYSLLLFELVRYLKYFLLYWALRTYIASPLYLWGIVAINVLMLIPSRWWRSFSISSTSGCPFPWAASWTWDTSSWRERSSSA
jgi:hypothetical protein